MVRITEVGLLLELSESYVLIRVLVLRLALLPEVEDPLLKEIRRKNLECFGESFYYEQATEDIY